MKERIPLLGLLIIASIGLFLASGTLLAQERPEVRPERVEISKSFHLFPNPAVEFVHVRTEEVKVERISLALYNIIGNKIEVDAEIVDEHELRVKVKDLASGYYLLAVKDEDSKFRGTYKFLKR